jgi:hypothetical protein
MQYLPSGRAYYPPHDFGLVDNFWTAEPWWVIQGYQRHLLQLALADRLLGELLDRLEAEGLYDAALVIVAADHGASFWPGQSRRNPSDMEHPEDVLAVPLLVKTPGQREGRRSLRDVTTLDILPTIADALGIAIPWQIDGCSALDEACPARAHRVMSDRDDAVLTFPNDLPLRRASLERKLEIFGAGSSNARLFRVGPYRDLVGQRVATLAVAGPAPERAHLMRRPFVLAQERPEQFALARITGTLQVHGENAPHVAVAVDGTIRAVVPALPSAGGGLFFSALVDEATAPRSRASLALYTVRGPADAPQLRRIESVLAEFRVLPRAALPDAD